MFEIKKQKNVFGLDLEPCCGLKEEETGFFRDGYCNTHHILDEGLHGVCVKVDKEFLNHQKSIGNDLITPVAEYDFPGLEEGDYWCVCVSKVKQAIDEGVNVKIKLSATNEEAKKIISLDVLKKYAIDLV